MMSEVKGKVMLSIRGLCRATGRTLMRSSSGSGHRRLVVLAFVAGSSIPARPFPW
jgi:hypothetical protein